MTSITLKEDAANKKLLQTLEKEHFHAVCGLMNYYITNEKNAEKANKFQLMAIEMSNDGNTYGMLNMAKTYRIYKNYEKAKEYYFMAMEKGNTDAMKQFIKHIELFYFPYEKELKTKFLLLNPPPKLKQFLITHKHDISDCPICFERKQLYRYDCFVHSYCIECLKKLSTIKKCCAICRMKEHPDHKNIFAC